MYEFVGFTTPFDISWKRITEREKGSCRIHTMYSRIWKVDIQFCYRSFATYVSEELPPRQESVMGHSRISSLLLFGRHVPLFSSTVASVDPTFSQLMSSEQVIHVLLPFMYESFSHTHVVLPSPSVVIFFEQESQMMLFGTLLYLPLPHTEHCV